MLHYLLGCDARNNHPSAILKLTNYMKQQGAKIEVCCQTKEDLFKTDDVIVKNCTLL